MGKNAFLERVETEKRACFRAGLETGRQQIIDMVCCVLHDAEYVGKDTFGKDRLLRLVQGISDYLDKFDPAFNCNNETDYYQSKFDKLLKSIFGEQTDSFSVRYPYCKEFDYTKGKWK